MPGVKQGDLPPLAEERKTEPKALADKPDSEIDYSDIPPLDDANCGLIERKSIRD